MKFFRTRGREDFGIGGTAFVDSKAKFFRYEWLDAIEEEVVELGTGLTSDFDGVFEARCRHQSRAGSFALEECIRADSGAMQQDESSRWRDLLHCVDDRSRGIGRCRENLQHLEIASLRINPDAIGESASGIDGDPNRLGGARHVEER